MIIEIRKYTLKPGRREDFVTYFETVNRPALRDAGMLVFGPMRDLDNPDVVHWMRAFENEEQRQKIKDTFYDGPVWTQDVEPVVMPMIEKFEASIAQTTDGFLGFTDTPKL
ncbi:NIPSNAP family protein [Octadecabacter sp. G9-8]|uniref:NIPSNAP family protein n=1 Tax=Octadecabacter dasysiphoniae TaxID=2909341 RepID=A0ABS9CVG7_9RHOB|nr:antibiotic biosynthesis monooxygenase [Octadecabacter dasysiphoniae]MCF2871281.1 NIPSNAP family protein [Octadecabacter dasysiphoniae]